jgi:hypothetical protein
MSHDVHPQHPTPRQEHGSILAPCCTLIGISLGVISLASGISLNICHASAENCDLHGAMNNAALPWILDGVGISILIICACWLAKSIMNSNTDTPSAQNGNSLTENSSTENESLISLSDKAEDETKDENGTQLQT